MSVETRRYVQHLSDGFTSDTDAHFYVNLRAFALALAPLLRRTCPLNRRTGGCTDGYRIISYRFIQTFDQNFVLFARHHYLQTSSDDASFTFLLFKSKNVSK